MLKKFLLNHLPPGIIFRLRKFNQRRIEWIYYILRVFPLNNKKIVITSYYGKGYGDNGKYIVEELTNRNFNYDLVWIVNNNGYNNFPKQVRTVLSGSLKAKFEEVTAKVWIDNCRKSSLVRKRKGQFYIQTWHGGIALKQVERDAEVKLHTSYIQNAKNDSKMADLFISNSKFCTNMYRSAFWYNGEIFECGSPRCDILINKKNEVDDKVRNYFNIDTNRNILVYAPTFRANHNTNVYNINFGELVKILEKKFGGNWVIMVRLHPNISNKDNFIEYNSTIINATSYDDMYELLAVSDVLITDYSSTMFEFSYAKKPVFLYASDIEEYIDDRNFYFDIRSLPYPLAEDNYQLFDVVEKFDESKYKIDVSEFLSELGNLEQGDASRRVVDVIDKVIGNNLK
jgi:CDP-glycerol glycerophosphotransferase